MANLKRTIEKNHSGSKTKKSNRKKKMDKSKRSQEDTINASDVDIENMDSNRSEENISGEEQTPPKLELGRKNKERLKKKIVEWLDYDDKIKLLNNKAKKYKDAKKQQEEYIMQILVKFGIEKEKLDIQDDNNQLRSRVYRHKSITKGSINEDIIKNALMEVIRKEKIVDELVKKIESKRQINERYYLKRTKGNKDK